MTGVATYSSSLNSLLAGMLARTPGAVHAVLATVDGVQVAISPDVPVLSCDARTRDSTKNVLIALVEHVLSLRRPRATSSA